MGEAEATYPQSCPKPQRLFIFLSALFALFLLQVAPAQAISLGSKTASAKGPDTLLIIQLDPNYVGKPGEIEKRIFDSFADEVKKAGHTVVPFAQAQKDLRIYLREEGVSRVLCKSIQ